MAYHPVNLALRFLLELSALGILAYWGYKLGDSGLKFLWMILLPLIAAIAWGVFNVPGDPSRSGAAPVAVSGVVRLIIELIIFASAVFALYQLELNRFGLIFGLIVLLHYASSYNRISWLLSQ
jgi:hypothetical protein